MDIDEAFYDVDSDDNVYIDTIIYPYIEDDEGYSEFDFSYINNVYLKSTLFRSGKKLIQLRNFLDIQIIYDKLHYFKKIYEKCSNILLLEYAHDIECKLDIITVISPPNNIPTVLFNKYLNIYK